MSDIYKLQYGNLFLSFPVFDKIMEELGHTKKNVFIFVSSGSVYLRKVYLQLCSVFAAVQYYFKTVHVDFRPFLKFYLRQ